MEKLIEKFNKNILDQVQTELNNKNIYETPRLEKVVVSVGVGELKDDDNAISKVSAELSKIVGQKPKINKSKKSVAAFKLRTGQPVGLTVTLRREKMFDFIDKLVNVALPRVRDFRGLPKKSFDDQGNYSIGIKDYTIFPEVKYEEVTRAFGLQINVKTTARNKDEALILLSNLGFPFEKKEERKGK